MFSFSTATIKIKQDATCLVAQNIFQKRRELGIFFVSLKNKTQSFFHWVLFFRIRSIRFPQNEANRPVCGVFLEIRTFVVQTAGRLAAKGVPFARVSGKRTICEASRAAVLRSGLPARRRLAGLGRACIQKQPAVPAGAHCMVRMHAAMGLHV